MFGLGIGEIMIILFLALILIGPKKLPELAKSLGKGIREFQNATQGLKDQITNPETTPVVEKSVEEPTEQKLKAPTESIAKEDVIKDHNQSET